MPEWASAAAAAVLVLALAAGIASLIAAVDARSSGAPVGAALLAPATESARLLRQTRRRTPTRAGVLGGVLLVAALLQAALLPLAAVPAGLVVVAVLLAAGVVSARLLAQPPGTPPRRASADAVSVAVPPVLALAGPAIAAGGLRLADAAGAQRDLWSAVSMPAALAVLLAGVVAAVPAAPAGARALSGIGRLVAQAGRAALLAVAAATAALLFLGGGAGPVLPPWLWILVKAVVVAVVLVAAVRLLPSLRPRQLARAARLVALPLVLVQLVVVALVGAAGVGGR